MIMNKGLKFDFTVNFDTLLLVAVIVGQAAVGWYRLSNLEKNVQFNKNTLTELSEKNNEAHMKIVETLTRTSSLLDAHTKDRHN